MSTYGSSFRCLVFMFLVGFASQSITAENAAKPPAKRFKVVSVARGNVMHGSSRDELYYEGDSGRRTLIWRFLSNQLLYTNDIALFHGYLTSGPKDPDGPTRRKAERLFVVHGQDPVVDITDDVIKMWASAAGTNYADVLRSGYACIGELQRTNGDFAAVVYIIQGTDGIVQLPLQRMLTLIQDAKDHGKQMKDPGFGTPYLKREWDLETKAP